VVGSARLDTGVGSTKLSVDLRKGRDGGGESSDGDDGELHFCGGGFGWLVGLVGLRVNVVEVNVIA